MSGKAIRAFNEFARKNKDLPAWEKKTGNSISDLKVLMDGLLQLGDEKALQSKNAHTALAMNTKAGGTVHDLLSQVQEVLKIWNDPAQLSQAIKLWAKIQPILLAVLAEGEKAFDSDGFATSRAAIARIKQGLRERAVSAAVAVAAPAREDAGPPSKFAPGGFKDENIYGDAAKRKDLKHRIQRLREKIEDLQQAVGEASELRRSTSSLVTGPTHFWGGAWQEIEITEFANPNSLLTNAETYLANGNLVEAEDSYQASEGKYLHLKERFKEYEEETQRGGKRVVGGLEAAKVAGAIGATVATGGVVGAAVTTGAISAGAGTLVMAGAAGGYAANQNLAAQASEVHFGLRDKINWTEVVLSAATAAVTTYFGGKAGNWLLDKLMSNPAIASLGRKLVANVLADYFAGRLGSTIDLTIRTVYLKARGGDVTWEQFFDQVGDQLLDPKQGLQELVLGHASRYAMKSVTKQIIGGGGAGGGVGGGAEGTPATNVAARRDTQVAHPPPMPPGKTAVMDTPPGQTTIGYPPPRPPADVPPSQTQVQPPQQQQQHQQPGVRLREPQEPPPPPPPRQRPQQQQVQQQQQPPNPPDGKNPAVPTQPVETPGQPTPGKGGEVAPTGKPKKRFGGNEQGEIMPNPTKGDMRELNVSNQVKGKVAKLMSKKGHLGDLKIKTPKGNISVDVLGPNGELVIVGGPAKGMNLSAEGGRIKNLKDAAAIRGVKAQAYYEQGTPQEVITFAQERLGKDNVFIFEP